MTSLSLPTTGFSYTCLGGLSLVVLSDSCLFDAITDQCKPLFWEKGSITLKILQFIKDRGFFLPESHLVEATLNSVGYKPSYEIELLRLKHDLPEANFRIVKNGFKNLMIFFQSNIYDIASQNPLIVHITPSIQRPLASHNLDIQGYITQLEAQFEDFRAIYHKGLHTLYDRSFSQGIIKAWSRYKRPILEALQSKEPISFLKFETLPYFIIDKTGETAKFFAVKDQPFYEGSCKTMYPAMALGDYLIPLAFSSAEHSEQEITLRKIPKLKELFSKLHLFWGQDEHTVFSLTELSSLGNLEGVLSRSLSLKQKDSLAMQMISLVARLHEFGIYKQIDLASFIVDETAHDMIVNLCDLNHIALNHDLKALSTLTNPMVNYAPEMIKELLEHGKSCSHHEVSHNFDAGTWQLANIYSLGILLAQIYLDDHPYRNLIDETAIRERFCLCSLSFETLIKSNEHLTQLHRCMTNTDLKEPLLAILQKGFHGPAESLRIEGIPSFEKESFRLDYDLQVHMIKFIGPSDLDELLNIYEQAHQDLFDKMYANLDEALSTCIAHSTENLLDRLSTDCPHTTQRLSIIKQMTHIDPTKRISLKKATSSFFSIKDE